MKNIVEASKPFEIVNYGFSPVLYYPKDHPLIKTLLRVYQEETGDLESKIIASGGGTYAKEADNIVALVWNIQDMTQKCMGSMKIPRRVIYSNLWVFLPTQLSN